MPQHDLDREVYLRAAKNEADGEVGAGCPDQARARVREGTRCAHRTMTAEEYLALNLKGWHEVCWRYDGAGGVGVRYYTDGILPESTTVPASNNNSLSLKSGAESITHPNTEIEAMAKVIGDKAVELARGKWEIEWPWLRDPDSNAAVDLRELARAALTAAALVRERADNGESRGLDVKCKCGWAGKQADLIWAKAINTTYHCPRCGDKFLAWPETEPDSGPSVLGNEE